MYLTGIGGGGFMLVRAPNGSYEFIDFRETAPAAAFEDMYKNNVEASLVGGLASGVPGEIRGLQHLHRTYGSLPWAVLVRPAIEVARYGFRVGEDLVTAMDEATDGSANFLVEDPAWAIDFAPNGTRVGLGDIMTRRRYADLLEDIAERGPDFFYADTIANKTIAAVQAANGIMTLDDLKNYTVAIRRPVEIEYRGFKLTSCSAPSSGAVVLSVMKTVEGYSGLGDGAMVNLSTHRLDEAIRFGYGARVNLGDPSFVDNMDVYQQKMLRETTAAEIRSKISDLHTLPVSAYNPNGLESLETPGTSHIVTADAAGMVVSLTSTINLAFGSHVIVPETGLIMNNEMNDFSIPGSSNAFGFLPSPSNFIRPGKRPISSISNVIAEFLSNRTFYFAVGAAGGSKIITATVQALWHTLDWNMTSIQAVESPRFHDQLIPNQIFFEYLYDNRTTAFMQERGHNITWFGSESDVQALKRLPNGTFEVAAEPRLVDSGGYAV
ncbi:hypothetical protein GP486_001779 [Trichoglossum hirsutum]|uniref:Gamma-glutamyltransferase n=1 Tax=Trichoglossum hirsutum TaxID=265104 RepID=A0A9P8LG15_9PEZI|nr:hypothetical protein GP486_001779 [Trichoglossum hirsutum]